VVIVFIFLMRTLALLMKIQKFRIYVNIYNFKNIKRNENLKLCMLKIINYALLVLYRIYVCCISTFIKT